MYGLMAMKRSKATSLRPTTQQSAGECYSSDRRLGGGGCWYRTNFRIEQSSNNSKHNGNISSLSPPSTHSKKKKKKSSPLLLTHHILGVLVLAGLRSYLSLHFLFSIYIYIYMLCVPHYYECDGPGRTSRWKTALRLFLSSFFSVFL